MRKSRETLVTKLRTGIWLESFQTFGKGMFSQGGLFSCCHHDGTIIKSYQIKKNAMCQYSLNMFKHYLALSHVFAPAKKNGRLGNQRRAMQNLPLFRQCQRFMQLSFVLVSFCRLVFQEAHQKMREKQSTGKPKRSPPPITRQGGIREWRVG